METAFFKQNTEGGLRPIRRALVSVSDKNRLIPLASELHRLGVELISTGGTAKHLQSSNLPVTDVSDYTGSPELLSGRVKTLHSKIHAGLLARLEDDKELENAEIPRIDLLIVNFYPFSQAIRDKKLSLSQVIEHIDIGGPTLLRGAAKNYVAVTVLSDPNDYSSLIDELTAQKGCISLATRQHLAVKAFQWMADYDRIIADYFQTLANDSEDESSEFCFPETLTLNYQKKDNLRYGENPQQSAAFYVAPISDASSLIQAEQLQGKPLSFNNIVDADTAWECVKQLENPACVIVKHANPCGVAQSHHLEEAYQAAYACDPVSSFGGIVAFNRVLDLKTTQSLYTNKQFVEVIIAPGIDSEAQALLAKKSQLRVLITQQLFSQHTYPELKTIRGGLLMQTPLSGVCEHPKIVTLTQPTEQQWADLRFAWQVVTFVKSNAIVYASEGATLGIGAGQMSRIFSAEIAALKAQQGNHELTGAVMASDAFFPFADSIELAKKMEISAIIQPGGSKRDKDVIDAANEAKIAMVMTGQRCFRH